MSGLRQKVELAELSCTNSGCTFDMRKDRDTRNAVANYLTQLVVDVRNDRVRHVSLSVHRAGKESDDG